MVCILIELYIAQISYVLLQHKKRTIFQCSRRRKKKKRKENWPKMLLNSFWRPSNSPPLPFLAAQAMQLMIRADVSGVELPNWTNKLGRVCNHSNSNGESSGQLKEKQVHTLLSTQSKWYIHCGINPCADDRISITHYYLSWCFSWRVFSRSVMKHWISILLAADWMWHAW